MTFFTITIKGILKFFYILISVIIILVAAYFSVSAKSVETTNNLSSNDITIIIDAGHGGLTNTID